MINPYRIKNLKVLQISVGHTQTTLIDTKHNSFVYDGYSYEQISTFRVKQISNGSNSSIFIDLNDNIWGFGSNYSGRLGLDMLEEVSLPVKIMNVKVKQVSTNYTQTIILDLDNNVWVCGSYLHAMVISVDN